MEFFDLLKKLFLSPELKDKLYALVDVYRELPIYLAVPILILVLVGRKFVSGSPAVRRNGLRLGLATFLAFVGFEYWRDSNFESKMRVANVGLQAFSAGGAVMATVWIVVPVTSFLYTHLRVALAALLGSLGYSLCCTPDEPAEMGIRAGIVVGVTLLIAWILHPIWDYIRDMLPKPKARPAREVVAEEGDEDERPQRREKAEGSRPTEPLPAPMPVPVLAAPPVAAQPMISMQVPLPQAASLEIVSAHLEIVSAPQTDEQRRRDRIRLQVEMAYVMSTPHLGSRLPREAFNELLHRYLGDHLPLEDVEENSRQLMIILQDQHKQTQYVAPPPPPTLTSLAVLAPPVPTPAPAAVPTAALEELLRRLLDEQRRAVAESRFPDSANHATASNHHEAPNSGVASNGSHPV